ncbi:hypothetical protein GW891_04870, partial [bacterium]|nr:hypothetical protein [bacterium]
RDKFEIDVKLLLFNLRFVQTDFNDDNQDTLVNEFQFKFRNQVTLINGVNLSKSAFTSHADEQSISHV